MRRAGTGCLEHIHMRRPWHCRRPRPPGGLTCAHAPPCLCPARARRRRAPSATSARWWAWRRTPTSCTRAPLWRCAMPRARPAARALAAVVLRGRQGAGKSACLRELASWGMPWRCRAYGSAYVLTMCSYEHLPHRQPQPMNAPSTPASTLPSHPRPAPPRPLACLPGRQPRGVCQGRPANVGV